MPISTVRELPPDQRAPAMTSDGDSRRRYPGSLPDDRDRSLDHGAKTAIEPQNDVRDVDELQYTATK